MELSSHYYDKDPYETLYQDQTRKSQDWTSQFTKEIIICVLLILKCRVWSLVLVKECVKQHIISIVGLHSSSTKTWFIPYIYQFNVLVIIAKISWTSLRYTQWLDGNIVTTYVIYKIYDLISPHRKVHHSLYWLTDDKTQVLYLKVEL